jgi:hypothetical protein
MTDLTQGDLIAALDKNHTSPELVRVLKVLGIAEADLEPHPWDKLGGRLVESKERGFQLEFTDEGKHRKLSYHDVGEGPWVLVQVFLRSGVDGGRRYSGQLPYGITFDMTREALAKTLGAPATSKPIVETWQKDGHRVLVNFDRASGSIKSVGLQVPTGDE